MTEWKIAHIEKSSANHAERGQNMEEHDEYMDYLIKNRRRLAGKSHIHFIIVNGKYHPWNPSNKRCYNEKTPAYTTTSHF